MIYKDCIHYEACKDIYYPMSTYDEEAKAFDESDSCDGCQFYSDKSRFIELPCKVGTKVWILRKDRVPDDDYRMSFHDEWMPCEVSFQLSMINQIGKTVFFTCYEAEKALERSKGND